VERREKSEKAPALYDLTTLQRDANRILGYTAQETLDYLQALYEKKLCTYPRTDSRYLTDDMENAVPNLVSIAATLCGVKAAGTVSAAQVCSSKKVSDHHAIVPTPSAATVDLASLPLGEREILRLVSLALVRAVCPPYRYAETVVTADCGGQTLRILMPPLSGSIWNRTAPPNLWNRSWPMRNGWRGRIPAPRLPSGRPMTAINLSSGIWCWQMWPIKTPAKIRTGKTRLLRAMR
ncbi:DNA topoisomerase, partial [uncultured Oscillibacter sp.]|uniref:DNA topoisomerase n=1 Tax=uncultured Oscillibacter sp. TaxID=876091 RepID=UPI00272AA066